jgi:hypothetical protein
LIGEPDEPNQINTKLRNPVSLRSDNANVLVCTFCVVWVGDAVEFDGPEVVRWSTDISQRVLKSLQEEGGNIINVWKVLTLIRIIGAQYSIKQTEHSNPNEHENGKVDAITNSSAYKLHQKSKFGIGLHELENFESNVQRENAIGEQEVGVD